jgi:hypothetical protein
MSDDDSKGPVGQAVEALVYAPIGLIFEGPTLLPKLVEQGKTHARNARFVGKFAVQQGQLELRRRLAAVEEQATDVLRAFGVGAPAGTDDHGGAGETTGSTEAAATAPPSATAPTTSASPSGGSPNATATESGTGATAAEVPGEPGAPAERSPSVAELAITDYDSLSASQVVTRLAGLSGGELEAVRAYEVAHRGRKTILNKIAQLQG